jgi:hypothetical protein
VDAAESPGPLSLQRLAVTVLAAVAILGAFAAFVAVASRPGAAGPASAPELPRGADAPVRTLLPTSARPGLVIYVVASEAHARDLAAALLEGEGATVGTAAGRHLPIVVVVPPGREDEFRLHVAELDYYRLEGGLAAARIEDLRAR